MGQRRTLKRPEAEAERTRPGLEMYRGTDTGRAEWGQRGPLKARDPVAGLKAAPGGDRTTGPLNPCFVTVSIVWGHLGLSQALFRPVLQVGMVRPGNAGALGAPC